MKGYPKSCSLKWTERGPRSSAMRFIRKVLRRDDFPPALISSWARRLRFHYQRIQRMSEVVRQAEQRMDTRPPPD